MDDFERLLEKLRRIEALFAGATTPGERDAAALARERIQAKVKESRATEAPVEFKFSLNNEWSRKLFIALLRRYGLEPYRYSRQRYNTVMVRVTRSFCDKTLWPEFLKLDEALLEHLNAVAEKVISQAIFANTSDLTEIKGALEGSSAEPPDSP